MNQENTEIEVSKDYFLPLRQVTTVSKYMAMVLFIILPFLGGWIGYTYAPEKVVEVERIIDLAGPYNYLSLFDVDPYVSAKQFVGITRINAGASGWDYRLEFVDTNSKKLNLGYDLPTLSDYLDPLMYKGAFYISMLNKDEDMVIPSIIKIDPLKETYMEYSLGALQAKRIDSIFVYDDLFYLLVNDVDSYCLEGSRKCSSDFYSFDMDTQDLSLLASNTGMGRINGYSHIDDSIYLSRRWGDGSCSVAYFARFNNTKIIPVSNTSGCASMADVEDPDYLEHVAAIDSFESMFDAPSVFNLAQVWGKKVEPAVLFMDNGQLMDIRDMR